MFDAVCVTSSLNMFWNAMRIQDLCNCARIVIHFFWDASPFSFLIVCTCSQALYAQSVEVSKQLECFFFAQWSCSNVVLCHSCSKAWETRMSYKSICESDFSQSWQVQLGSLPVQEIAWPKFSIHSLGYLASWAWCAHEQSNSAWVL